MAPLRAPSVGHKLNDDVDLYELAVEPVHLFNGPLDARREQRP
jgi:hypothetical protein